MKPFDCRNLKVGKTYKGLINDRTFTVIGTKRKQIFNNRPNIYKEVFIIATDENKILEISPRLRLYIQEL